MARLLNLEYFKECPIPEEDPLRLYYFPVIGSFYHRRIDVAMSLIGKGTRVLDVGFGSGTSFLELSTRFDNIYGLDMHQYGGVIKEIFVREGIDVRLSEGSILDPPYEDNFFDAIIAVSVLEHLHPVDLPRVMAQASRLLRPGGIFVIGIPGFNSMMSAAFRVLGCDISKHHFSSPHQVLEAAATVFEIEEKIKLPSIAPDFCLLYTWFRARKADAGESHLGKVDG
jgi:ubiquinone/menaquinone biosynthesis C-methylase UbiE